jgi:hypothetical protein
VTGVGFQPDLVSVKSRSTGYTGYVFDSVRGSGSGKGLATSHTSAEGFQDQYGYLTSFDSDGFSTTGGSDGGNPQANMHEDVNYVGWFWKAGNATLGTGDFTQGTIASTCSRNVDAGFSIVSYTGTGVDLDTVGHGLSKAPEMYIVKNRDQADLWAVGAAPHIDRAYNMALNAVNTATSEDAWGNKAPTSTVLKLGQNVATNTNGEKYIGYMFHSVDGYSKVGSYTGNGSSDGTFVFLGFRAKYIMLKVTTVTDSWYIYDIERETYNSMDTPFQADTSGAEATSAARTLDILSNGFKLIGTDASVNGSGKNYLYLAFAESPFKHTNAR